MRRTLLVCTLALFASDLRAQSFTHFGARAMGMGGAGVAVADDLTAVYWNPAALALGSPREIAIVVGGQGADERDSIGKVRGLVDLNLAAHGRIITPEDISKALDYLEGLTQPGSGVNGELDISGMFRYKSVAVSVLALGTGSAVPIIDLDILSFDPTSGEPLPTDLPALDFTGVVTKQFVMSYCREVVRDSLWVGGNMKYIRADTYYASRLIVDPANSRFRLRDIVDEATGPNQRSDSAYGVDAGVLALLVANLRMGIVGRDINSPEFTNVGPWKAELNPQYRMGIAYQVVPALLVAADYDLSKNNERVLHLSEREFALGGEGRLFNRILAIRGGLSKNVEDDTSKWRYSFGLGVNTRSFSLDVAGATDSDANQAALMLSGTIRY